VQILQANGGGNEISSVKMQIGVSSFNPPKIKSFGWLEGEIYGIWFFAMGVGESFKDEQ
jgi:hypothetical protein